jgi:maltose alpha-D-glucosyltransferase/alpha-amylase
MVLARRTAELHHALARTTGDPAFDPEPITEADLAQWGRKVQQDAERTLDQLASRSADLPATVQPQAELLLGLRQALAQRISACVPQRVQAAKTRYHGDYHLGQVLLTINDFVIIDFEGEPARPLHERRIKHSPLRDVAGMLRSFNYAAAVALDKSTAQRPQDRERLAPSLASWRQDMTSAFISSYRDAIHGCASYPEDEVVARQLLDLFIIEKSLYELRYELDNRPDWTRIPLAGILELVHSRAT